MDSGAGRPRGSRTLHSARRRIQRQPGHQLDEIRQFINAQPDSVKIGVAYMQDGTAKIVQNLTSDHAQAAKALRLPMGMRGTNGSPYFSLDRSDQTLAGEPLPAARFSWSHGWNRPLLRGRRRKSDPYLEKAVDDAATPASWFRRFIRPELAHSVTATGRPIGDSFILRNLRTKPAAKPTTSGSTERPSRLILISTTLTRRLSHQYFLTFLAKPPKKAGWQSKSKLRSEVSSVDLVSADKVWVSPEGK
jgi:hypothetical protein